MYPIQYTPDPVRASFNRVLKTMAEASGMTPAQVSDNFIINQGTLRLEALASSSRNSYTFEVGENKGSDRPLERKLNQNNLFFLTEMALCLTKQDASTTPAQYANFPLFTHPDPNFFSGDDSSNPKEFQALETVYNGLLNFKTKPVERISEFPTFHMRYVPEKGYTIAPGAGPQLENEWPQYGPDLAGRGFFANTPNVLLDGYQSNSIVLELGSGDTTLIEGTVNNAGASVNTRNVIVLLLHGFEIQNGAQNVGKWTAR